MGKMEYHHSSGVSNLRARFFAFFVSKLKLGLSGLAAVENPCLCRCLHIILSFAVMSSFLFFGCAKAKNPLDNIKFSSITGRIHADAFYNDNINSGSDPLELGSYNPKFSNFQISSAVLNSKLLLFPKMIIDLKLEVVTSGIPIKELFLKYDVRDDFSVLVGQSVVPSSLESSTSFSRTMLNTYSLFCTSKIFGLYSSGLTTKYIKDRFGIFNGIYGNSIHDKLADRARVIFITRLFALPHRNGDNLTLLGFNFYDENRWNAKITEPGHDNSNVYSLKHIQRFGVELALNYNFFNLQSEYRIANLAPDKSFNGNRKTFKYFYNFYTEMSFILTGETLMYKDGAFNFLNVLNPVNRGGYGAFALSFRYARTNLQSKEDNFVFDYGIYSEYAVALNWTPLGHLRFTLQYARMEESFRTKASNGYDLFHLKMRFYF